MFRYMHVCVCVFIHMSVSPNKGEYTDIYREREVVYMHA